jgi:glutamine synthetase
MASKSINNQNQQEQELLASSAYATALLRSLHFSGVKFLRFYTVDVCNNVRCKVKPVDHLLLKNNNNNNNNNNNVLSLDHQVSVAEVCYAGLPYYADYMIDGTGMNAKNVLMIQPDLNSFRILPYSPKSAIVMGNLYDQYTNESSPLCTRSLLGKVVQDAIEKHNITFVSI